jgi:hypothetical protein
MKNKQNAVMEFEMNLEKVILSIRERANNQFKYNLETNIPEKIAGISFDNAAQDAVNSGLVSAISAMNEWDTDKATLFAHSILEDSNCHGEARELVKFIPQCQLRKYYWYL